MADISKGQYSIAKEILKTGILRRHEQWQVELSELLNCPYDDEIGNAYDRSMAITRMSRDWYKEADKMESGYGKQSIVWAIRWLTREGFIKPEELEPLLQSADYELQRFFKIKD